MKYFDKEYVNMYVTLVLHVGTNIVPDADNPKTLVVEVDKKTTLKTVKAQFF